MAVVLDAALSYHRKGWAIIPVPVGEKAPKLKNWQNLEMTEAEIKQVFTTPHNIGVLLGEKSGGLVDVDLDSPEAVRLADIFLPATDAVFGRASKPASHRLYRAEGAKTERFTAPDGAVLVEIRATGHQTIFPPSIHPEGEAISWTADGDPAPVEYAKLREAVAKLAAAALLVRHWPSPGSRQEAALALAGALLRAGFSEEETRRFIEAVANAAGDEETKKRAETAIYTARKLGHTPVTGWPRLAELVSEDVAAKLQDWLGAQEGGRNRVTIAAPRIWTAEELAAADFPEPSWLVPGLLPEGGLVLLAGKPKVGKSWLALDIACGLSCGGSVCGVPVTRRVKTLYLALEDTPRRLQARMSQARFAVSSEALFATTYPRLDQGGLEMLRETVEKESVSVVLLDTLAKIRGKRDGRKVVSLYDDDYASLEGLKALADDLGITVVVIHHLRKAGSLDPVEEVSGTTGLTGAVDTVMVLKRGRSETDGTLFITGRDVEEKELALSFSGGRWLVIGDAEEYALTKERRELLQAIQELGGAARPKEISDLLGKNHNTVKVLLRKLEAEGVVNSVRGCYCINSVNPVNRINPVNSVNRINPVYGHKPTVSPAEAYSHKEASGTPVYAVYTVYANEHKPVRPHQAEIETANKYKPDQPGEGPIPEDFGEAARGCYRIRHTGDEATLLELIRQAEIQGDQENLRRLVEEYQALLRQRGEVIT